MQKTSPDDTPPTLSDNRHTALKMAHAFSDVFLSTAVILIWQRLYGSIETGWMTTILRVFNFLPVLVTMAWAQVVLAKPHQAMINPWWIGLAAFACLIVVSVCCYVAVYLGWLDTRWDGVLAYLTPLVLWQGCACLAAAFSHRPFQTQAASAYSWACMSIVAVQSPGFDCAICNERVNRSRPTHVSICADKQHWATCSDCLDGSFAKKLKHSHLCWQNRWLIQHR